MNAVEENNSLSILERMPLVGLAAEFIQCATCLLVILKADLRAGGCVCPECGDGVCLTCGCTDSVACEEGCRWAAPGECSSHGGEE